MQGGERWSKEARLREKCGRGRRGTWAGRLPFGETGRAAHFRMHPDASPGLCWYSKGPEPVGPRRNDPAGARKANTPGSGATRLRLGITREIPMEKYIRRAVRLGAAEAKTISADTIVTAAWVRLKCQYGCGGYGQCLTCPPHSPTPEETARVLKGYRTAILIHGGDHGDVTAIAAKLEREAFLDGHYKAFAMGSGPCRLCDECDVASGECLHPDDARPAMEACGIDVFETARGNGFPIDVVRNTRCEQNYYAVVLME